MAPPSRETVLLLHDRRVTMRSIASADAGALMDFYAALSPEARQQRFFHFHQVRADEAQHMATIEARGCGVALVAVDDDSSIVADARCVRGNDTTEHAVGDLAIVVRDDYQGLGLGRLLLDRLIAAAAQAGITTVVAELFGSNAPMRRLLSRYRFTIVNRDGLSLVEGRLSADSRVPAWPADTTRPRVLIEAGSWYGSIQERNLRDAGFSVAVCPGSPGTGSCDLLATGHCRLAEGADAIICSGANEESCQVLAAHEAARTRVPLFLSVAPEHSRSTNQARTISSMATPRELLDALGAEGIQPPA